MHAFDKNTVYLHSSSKRYLWLICLVNLNGTAFIIYRQNISTMPLINAIFKSHKYSVNSLSRIFVYNLLLLPIGFGFIIIRR